MDVFIAGPQPDWAVVGNALDTLAQQVPMIPTAINAGPDHAALQAINAVLVNIQNTVTAIQNTVDNIQNEITLQPMRIANALASNNTPLVYPPGTARNVLAELPRFKHDALAITGDAAHDALVLLGIQPLQGANAEQLGAQFCRYIGV